MGAGRCGNVVQPANKKNSILDTNHPDTLHLREQVCEGPSLFFEVKRSPRTKKNWETLLFNTFV